MDFQDFSLKIVKTLKEFFELLEKNLSAPGNTGPESDSMLPMFSPEAIRSLSKKVGSQVELAKLLGVSSGTVNRWISNKSQPRHNHLVKMAAILREQPGKQPAKRSRKISTGLKLKRETRKITPAYINKLVKGVGSQRRLADMLKVHHVTVNKWVNRLSVPRIKILPRLEEIERKTAQGLITPIRKAPPKNASKPAKRGRPKNVTVKKAKAKRSPLASRKKKKVIRRRIKK